MRILSIIFFILLVNRVSIQAALLPDDIRSVYPKPDTRWAPPGGTIIVRFNSPVQMDEVQFNVRDTDDTIVPGEIIYPDDRNVVIFKPSESFDPNARITVRLSGRSDFTWTFQTTQSASESILAAREPNTSVPAGESNPMVGQIRTINGVTVPSDFPNIQTVQYGATAPGKIFLGSTFGTKGNYLIMLENDGTPAFYRKFPNYANGSGEFRVQPGNILTAFFYQHRHYIVFDHHYNQIDTLQCEHGFLTDAHELLITPNGHKFFICLDPQIVDMSQIVEGGRPEATVIGNHVQEQDAGGTVVFEWLSWDHYEIQDAIHENLYSGDIDYVHMNSIAVDFDGHIIISSRHLDEVTKIDHDTGEIIWRLGGSHNQFDFINDPYPVSYQHHARPVKGYPNHYTIFDNGNHRSPSFSRAVEYKLDTVAMTAEKVWEFRYEPDIESGMMGNAQRLPNGNTFINWADWYPSFACEVNPAGKVLFEMDLEISSNRIRRYEWDGSMEVPYLMAEPQDTGVMLIFNQFGDPDVDRYRVYGDTASSPESLLAETDETHVSLSGLPNSESWYFRVTSVDEVGHESAGSNEVHVQTRFLNPGDNRILNGDFSQGDQHWTLARNGDVVVTGLVNDTGEYSIEIENGGSVPSDIQLMQSGVGLVHEKRYRFEFDASARNGRTIETVIIQESTPGVQYGQIPTTFLQPVMQHFTYELDMTDPTDMNAAVVFRCGASVSDVFVDNVSLIEIPNAVADEPDVPGCRELKQNYPNPFNPMTQIDFEINRDERVNLSVYNIRGQCVAVLMDEFKFAGAYTLAVDGSALPAGLYFCKLQTPSFADIRKMMLLK